MFQWFRRRDVIKVRISIGANEFTVEAETTWAELRPLLDQWFAAATWVAVDTQAELDALTARALAATKDLETTVQAHQQ